MRLTTRVSVGTDKQDRVPSGPTGLIFPNLWLVGQAAGGLPHESASARSLCQSPPVELTIACDLTQERGKLIVIQCVA